MKRVLPFLLISFFFSWSIALLLYVTGIKLDNVASILLIGFYYMWGPAIAAIILQTYKWKEPHSAIGWRFDKKRRKWLFLTPVYFTAIFIIYFFINYIAGNIIGIEEFGKIDFSAEGLETRMAGQGGALDIAIPPALLFVLLYIAAVFIFSWINLPFVFGEEYGWRGYLLKNTEHMGFIRTNLFIGFFWGIWHAPLILMGHNYPDDPYTGVWMMTLACIAFTPVFVYLTHKSGSILIPCILHAILNGSAGSINVVHSGGSPLYYSMVGVAGIIAFILAGVYIFLKDKNYIRNFPWQTISK